MQGVEIEAEGSVPTYVNKATHKLPHNTPNRMLKDSDRYLFTITQSYCLRQKL